LKLKRIRRGLCLRQENAYYYNVQNVAHEYKENNKLHKCKGVNNTEKHLFETV
jgi:hypothetical protein